MSPPPRSSKKGKKSAKAFDKAIENDSLSRMASTPITVNTVRSLQLSSPVAQETTGNLPDLNLSRVEAQNQIPQSPRSPYVNGTQRINRLMSGQSPLSHRFSGRQQVVNFEESPQSAAGNARQPNRFRRNSRKDYDGTGPLGKLLTNSDLIPEIAGNFFGYRGRVNKHINRLKQVDNKDMICRKSLINQFAMMDDTRKTRKNANNEEIKASNDTSTSCNIASPDFDACQSPMSENDGACYRTPLRTRKDSYQNSPNYNENFTETPPLKRHFTRKSRATPLWSDDTPPQMTTRSRRKSPTEPTLPLSNDENNLTPPTRRPNGSVAPTKHVTKSAKNYISPYHRPPRAKINKTLSPLAPPLTPNTRSKQIEENFTAETSFGSQSAVNSTNVAKDSTGKFCESPRTLNFDEPKNSDDSDGSSKSVSRCLSQLSVSIGRSPRPELNSPISASPIEAIQTVFVKNGQNSLNLDALDQPFTQLDESELRYIQAASSTVLAVSTAHEDSLVYDSKRKSCSESNTSGKNACYPQPSGDSNPVEGKFSSNVSENRTRSICDYPTYRFCFEFMRPERLENSRFGLIFAARNRHDGRLYCIKKSRGSGDQLADKDGLMMEERNGPSFGEARQELQQEAIALGAISFHENIVRFFSTWVEYDCVYLQLEFCNGGSLVDYLNRKDEVHVLQKFRLLQLMGDIGSAIKHVHEHGMVHLDLTPGNILMHFPSYHENIHEQKETREMLSWRRDNIDRLMNDPEEKMIFKLADFGRSKYHDQSTIFDEVGDPEFMPPEVFGSIDGRMTDDVELFKIDVFSLGMTLYRAMGGEKVEKFGADIDKSDYHKLLVLPPKSDKQLSRFVQKSVKIPRLRPTIDDVLSFPGVCEASQSRFCMMKRIEQLSSASVRITRQHK